jgi:hypothetical protein
MRDVQQDFNLAKELLRNQRPEEDFLFAEELRHAQLAFQHHVEKFRRIALADDRFACLDANLSSRGKALALGVIEFSEKRDVKNCCKRSIRNGGLLKRERRFHLFEPLTELSHDRATCDDCLGGLVSLNPPHGQSHDESRLARFRFDLDLAAMPVSDDPLADREAETFS